MKKLKNDKILLPQNEMLKFTLELTCAEVEVLCCDVDSLLRKYTDDQLRINAANTFRKDFIENHPDKAILIQSVYQTMLMQKKTLNEISVKLHKILSDNHDLFFD